MQQPFACEIEHKMGVACVGGGLVKCRVALDRGGYVPGESVLVTAYISNNSNITIKRTKASLTEVKLE